MKSGKVFDGCQPFVQQCDGNNTSQQSNEMWVKLVSPHLPELSHVQELISIRIG